MNAPSTDFQARGNARAPLPKEAWVKMSLDLPHFNKVIFRQSSNGSPMQDFCQAANIGQQIAHLIFSSPDSETALKKIASVLGNIFESDACWIATSLDGNASQATSFSWVNDYVLSEFQVRSLEKLSQAKLLKVSHVVAIEDLQSDRTALDEDCRTVTLRAVLKISTQFQGQLNGIILIGKRSLTPGVTLRKNCSRWYQKPSRSLLLNFSCSNNYIELTDTRC